MKLIGPHWRVLLAHLILFGFVYPSERQRVPHTLLQRLTDRLQNETEPGRDAPPVCYGTLLSHSQYHVDISSGCFLNGRLQPHGPMTEQDLLDVTISTDDPDRPLLLQRLKTRSAGGENPSAA